MRKLLFIVIAAAFLLAPAVSEATTYKVFAKPIPSANYPANPSFEAKWPASAVQNDSVYVFVPNRPVYNPQPGQSGVYTLSISYCMGLGAAGGGAAADSVSVTWWASSTSTTLNSFVGTSIDASALQSHTLTAAAPCVSKSNIALTYWPAAAPYLVLACKVKGNTTLANRVMTISFPRAGASSY